MTREERYYVQQSRIRNPALPILTAYWDAKRHIHFRKTLSASIKATEKRSRAAKKARAARKATA